MAVELRELRAADRAPIQAMLHACSAFRQDEIAVALELVDAGLGTQSSDPYHFLVAVENEHAVGYACYGRTPMTDGVYDLYWIVVDPRVQRAGVGRRLLQGVTADVRARAGRMVIIETAGKPEYASQRAFYERSGAELLARYPDFYSVGDDKLVYLVRLRDGAAVR
jgi:D-alanine-D-alanine ligase